MANKIGATVCPSCGKSTLTLVEGVMCYRSVKGLCLTCSSYAYTKARRLKNKAVHGNTNGSDKAVIRVRNRERCRQWMSSLKQEVIEAYGGKCECCGEATPVFLTIDHRNGDGAEERRKHRGHFGGASLYKQLRDLGWPKDRYRLLCYNCNMAVGFYGSCPHDGK